MGAGMQSMAFGQANINTLPDEILHEVFSYLHPKDLCHCERVCAKWRTLVGSEYLRKCIDLSEYKMTVRQLMSFARKHLSERVQSLRVRGSVNGALQNFNPTINFFHNVATKCPHLTHLTITKVEMSNIGLINLPQTIVSLAVTEAYVPPIWFQPLSKSGVDGNPILMPHLRKLDLSASSKTSDACLCHIVSAWTQLTVLKLNRCYRVTAKGLRTIAEGLPHLEVLELGSTVCDGVAMHHICRNLAGTLRKLRVARCTAFDDGCAGTVAAMLVNLNSLDVSGCHHLTADAYIAFSRLSNELHVLNVASSSIDVQTLAQIRRSMPSCRILADA